METELSGNVCGLSAFQPSRSIEIVEDDFVLNGKRLHIVSGSLHYFRAPAVYWRDRLHKLKAAGLNSVSTLVLFSIMPDIFKDPHINLGICSTVRISVTPYRTVLSWVGSSFIHGYTNYRYLPTIE